MIYNLWFLTLTGSWCCPLAPELVLLQARLKHCELRLDEQHQLRSQECPEDDS